MAIKSQMVRSLEKEQAAADAANAAQAAQDQAEEQEFEKELEKQRLVDKARALAKKHATYSGSHVYLGRDALVRDYHSPWLNFAPLEDKPGTVIQLGIERRVRVVRIQGIERGTEYYGTYIKLRLYDTTRQVSSHADEQAVSFAIDDEVTISGQGRKRISLEPGTETWEEISTILDLIPELESTGRSSFDV